MPTRWMQAYAAALREQDPTNIPNVCEKARRAIDDRILQDGGQSVDASEREQLEAALRHLTEREWQAKRKPN